MCWRLEWSRMWWECSRRWGRKRWGWRWRRWGRRGRWRMMMRTRIPFDYQYLNNCNYALSIDFGWEWDWYQEHYCSEVYTKHLWRRSSQSMIWCDRASSYGNRLYLKKEYRPVPSYLYVLSVLQAIFRLPSTQVYSCLHNNYYISSSNAICSTPLPS